MPAAKKPVGRPRKPHGLLDGVATVNYNDGTSVYPAIVLNQVDAHTLVLGRFENGTLRQINDGNAVPERAPEDYDASGGGVTWYA